MGRRWTDIAIKRANDHYGVDLTPFELAGLWADCVEGRAFCGHSDGTSHVYIARVRGLTVVPVLGEAKAFIVTFLPANTFSAGALRERLKANGIQLRARCRGAVDQKRPYRRERITTRDALEEMG